MSQPYRPYASKPTQSLVLDYQYWFIVFLDTTGEQNNFAAMRMIDCQREFRFRGEPCPQLAHRRKA